MWTFVDEHWEQFGEEYDRADLAYFLARRISVSLSGLGIQEFVQNLEPPAPIANVVAENHVHPMQYYIIPPLKEAPPKCGDLFRGKIGEVDSYWMLLTPSCDLIKRGGNAKAEHVLLARCFKLSDEQEYTDLLEDLSNKTKKKHLRELLKNNRKSGQSERFYFLPGILNIPDQIADFQQLITLPYSHIEDLEHIASLDSPFSEAILARYARYTGRLGTPDLDIDVILERLFPEQQQ
jgi:hypothetical protein